MTIDICLPLVKYSYAIGCDKSTNSIPWDHLSAVDLFVVIKGQGTNNGTGPLVMNIIHATKVLEKVDIDQYIERAVRTRVAIEREGTSANIEQLPIFGITKDNLLALRYRLKDGQDHRTQLRMQTAADCRQIVDLFRWRGMEFREASARPGTSRAGGRPGTAQTDFRPLTAQSSSPCFSKDQPDHGRPSTVHGLLPGSPLRQSHRDGSTQNGDEARASPAIENMPPPRIVKCGEMVAPRKFAIERPTTAQTWRTRIAPDQPSGIADMSSQYGQTGPTIVRPYSYNNVENLEAVRQAAEEDNDAIGLPPPSEVPLRQQQDSPGALDPNHSVSQSSEICRPLTAASAASSAVPDTQEVEIGMKYELQLNAPWSRRSGSSSRPSSALDLPPLKKPQVEKRPSTALHDQTWATRATVQKRPMSSADASFYTAGDHMEPRKVIFSKQTQVQHVPQTVVPQPDSGVNVDAALPMDELLKRSREDLLRESALQRQSSLADAPHELESPPPPLRHTIELHRRLPSPSADVVRRDAKRSSRQAASNVGNKVPAEDRSLDEFAAQRPEDRQAALDDFMIENLENPSFTTLCEDVENCWRRIALGL
ncbi:hypothetical protein DOTSEDRAFT_20500 [Dothistroma septosporum NZE10]|uniref:Uncharacterized protein n=1 Tax=Dothistroma septosporum (strain NZE10 / CBS 128990) TaxID=675120 RepID=N1Q5A6_DOTSN|nr:hypothetical protein DOTSEDRAFT_20500 [Dothistroma septosporum NZE10]